MHYSRYAVWTFYYLFRVYFIIHDFSDKHVVLQIRLNQGVSGDNQVTPPPPDLIPPFNIIAPWCFKVSGINV